MSLRIILHTADQTQLIYTQVITTDQNCITSGREQDYEIVSTLNFALEPQLWERGEEKREQEQTC